MIRKFIFENPFKTEPLVDSQSIQEMLPDLTVTGILCREIA
jgi:hypothetical protein